jgi:hypothetical protein
MPRASKHVPKFCPSKRPELKEKPVNAHLLTRSKSMPTEHTLKKHADPITATLLVAAAVIPRQLRAERALVEKPLKTDGEEPKPSPHRLPVQNAALTLPIPRQQPGDLQYCGPFCKLSDCLELDV